MTANESIARSLCVYTAYIVEVDCVRPSHVMIAIEWKNSEPS